MWINLDFGGVSPLFMLGFLVRLYWPEVTVFLLVVVLVGLSCKGLARILVLASAVAVLAPVLAGLAAYYAT